MLTILEKSVSAGRVKHFRTHKWRSSNNLANTLTETFWNVKTPIRKHTFIEYLQLKTFLGYSSQLEVRLCYDAPGVLNDHLFLDALRARQTGVELNTLLQRMQYLQQLLERPVWSKNLYHTYDKCFVYEIEEIRRSIRKVKKYSGYVRNSSAVGSKRSSNSPKPEPEIFEWTTNEELDYFQFLSVGEFDSGPSGVMRFTLKSPRKDETEILNSKEK